MKIRSSLRSWLALCSLALATTALAQKEQWLEYHTTTDARTYHWLDLTTNPPPNVALPKLNAQPYFARWASPLDPDGGRWASFDRTRKSGPYDRVYFDTTGNGRLDDKTPVSAYRIDQYYAYFDPVRVVFKSPEGPITYHLLFRFMKYEGSQVQLLVSPGGYYAGNVDLAGKKRRLELIDGNVNGTFNDQAADPGDCDRVSVADDKAGERYLGKFLEVDGQLFTIEVARDGAFVKLAKAENVTFAPVHVPETISEFVAFGANGHFVRKPVKAEFKLPVGTYRVHNWRIERKDNKGASWDLRGYSGDQTFEVATGKTASPAVGEPIYTYLDAQQGTNRVDFNLSFRGRLGESIQMTKGNQNPPGPKLWLASVDGVFRATNTFEFG